MPLRKSGNLKWKHMDKREIKEHFITSEQDGSWSASWRRWTEDTETDEDTVTICISRHSQVCLRPELLLLLGALRYPSSFNKHTLLRHLLLLFGLLQEGFRRLMGLRLRCVHACASEKGRGASWERVEEFLHPFSMQVCYPHLRKWTLIPYKNVTLRDKCHCSFSFSNEV